MNAAILRELGDVNAFKHTDVPHSKTKPGHILIKVLAVVTDWLDLESASSYQVRQLQ